MNCNFIISILDFQSDDTSRLSKEVLTVSLDENPNFRQHDYDGNNQLDGIELIQGKTSSNQLKILTSLTSAMTHYERMDIEDRGGSDANYPRFSEDQFFDMGTLEIFNAE